MKDDIRQAIRGVRRRPGLAVLTVAMLSLGVGVTTSVFSIVDAVFVRPVPYDNAEQLVDLATPYRGGFTLSGVDPTALQFWRTQTQIFQQIESYTFGSGALRVGESAQQVSVQYVTPALMNMLGVRAIAGRAIAPSDGGGPGAPVMISASLWHSAFAAAPDIVSRSVMIDGVSHTVVGVAPSTFRVNTKADVFAAYDVAKDKPVQGLAYSIARVRPGMSPAALQTLVDTLSARQTREGAGLPLGWNLKLRPLLQSSGAGESRRAILLLAGASLLVLLVACVNVANLMLARTHERLREIAIRRALGASGLRVAQQLFVESTVYALIGGGLGIALAYWGVDVVVAMLPRDLLSTTYTIIAVNPRVLGFAVLTAALTPLLFGTWPAIRGARTQTALISGDRTSTGTRRGRQLRSVLVAAELALSMVLLVGAGLLIRSFTRQLATHVGFETANVLTMDFDLDATRYATAAQREQFYAAVVNELHRVPGMQSVTAAQGLAPGSAVKIGTAVAEGSVSTAAPASSPDVVAFTQADQEFFGTIGLPIISGRGFSDADMAAGPAVTVVDAAMAHKLWPNQDAVGKRFRFDATQGWVTVIGVAAHVTVLRAQGREAWSNWIYYPSRVGQLARLGSTSFSVAMRVAGDPRSVRKGVLEAVRRVDPLQPVTRLMPMSERMGASLAVPRFLLTFMTVFAAVAFVLATGGICGVLAYAVSQRTREIGIRMALGARGSDVLRDVVRQAATMSIAGVVIGGALAFGLSRFAASLLYEIRPTDPVALVGATAVLLAASIVAAIAPARRASKVSPLVAMSPE